MLPYMMAQNSGTLSSEVCILNAHDIHLLFQFLLNHEIHLYGNRGKRFSNFFVENFNQAIGSLIFLAAAAR
jgi:hypothetical protein